jgi:sugar phosphate isomerase/epimerase
MKICAASIGRRQLLAALAAGSCTAALNPFARTAQAANRSKMGVTTDSWILHDKFQTAKGQKGDLSDPQLFLERCRQLGAGGIQAPIGVRDEAYSTGLRRWAEAHEMFIEGCVDLAGNKFEMDRFEKEVLTAKAAGATVVRAVILPGRRYEEFGSEEAFTRSSLRAYERLRAAEPIVARQRIRLAVENHKDHRVDERLDLLKRLSSEWIGICVDTGNSFALCEDPMDVVRAYAPFAFSVHLRDHVVQECQEGFLFGEVALGKGFLDVPAMVRTLREARPEVRFQMEVIARDPLRVPVLTPKYWASMAGVPASQLSRTLRTVRAAAPREPLPLIGSLSLEQQVQCEQQIVEDSLAYARERLGL